jgi:hypothetical protein
MLRSCLNAKAVMQCCDPPVAIAHLTVEQQSMEVVHQALLQVMPLCLTYRVGRFLHADGNAVLHL